MPMTTAKLRQMMLIIAVACCLGSVWLGCGGNDGPKAATLRVIGEDYSPMQGLEKIKFGFTDETGVDVEITKLDAETLRKRYLAEFQSGGGAYDVIMGQGFDVGLFAVNEWPVNTSQALDSDLRDSKLDMAHFTDRLLDLSCRYDDTLWGLPCSAQCMFLWYRKDLFRSEEEQQAFQQTYGYPLPQPTIETSMTWSQYRDVAEFFTRTEGETAAGKTLKADLFGTVLQGKNHLALWFEFQNFLYSFGGKFVADDGSVQADSEAARRALEYYLSLKEFAPPDTVNYSWDEALLSFQNGQIAMAIMWSDSIAAVEDPESSMVAGKVGYAANPTLTEDSQPASVFGGWGFFVNKNSEHAEEAVRFIQWANRPEVQVEWAEHGGFPADISAYDATELTDVPGMDAHQEALRHLVAWTRAPYSARLVEIGQNTLARAVSGETSPEAALEQIASRYREIVEEYENSRQGQAR